ncbi:MAG: molecular chaperone DnaJ [Candidatus Peregrinibacteria bacterium]|nr:molecular chaperone DnaJ [Candidatus Peregrinibacteria bacterium]
MSKDYYSALGVKKGASKAEIKKAFRDKAKKHHPDKGGDEAEFKKINEAYETLSDDKKKAHYDQFGSAGPGAGGFGGGGAGGYSTGGFSASDFGGFEDIFSSFFGGGGGGGRQSARSNRGADLEVDVEISFEEMMNGCEKSFTSKNYEPCSKCDGAGGEGKKKCADCGGQGAVQKQFQTPFGNMAQSVTCPKCAGTGEGFDKLCGKCHGEGREEKKNKITINIPSGVDSGETLRVRDRGEAGMRGGSRGDLFVNISVKHSGEFHRRGVDLITELEISPFDAMMGGKFSVKTFWGDVDLKIPENTRDGKVFRIAKKGVKRGHQVGDHLVKIEYKMPKKISSKLKELLEKAKSLSS